MVDWTLLVFCALVFCAALTGAFFRPGPWYERLERPSWTPPDWAFPVVWTTLYAMIAAAGWLIWTEAGEGQRFVPLGFWALQLALNALWSPVFFGMRRLGPALVVAGGMWVSILACILTFWPVSPLAAGLMVPYLAWVSTAFALNLWIWRRNPDAHRLPA